MNCCLELGLSSLMLAAFAAWGVGFKGSLEV